jgi:D-glucosaminate-6-phosphate ammonia-lyase
MSQVMQRMEDPGWIYRELGVEPVFNCAGVRTQFGGSNPAPEVQAAMLAAAEAFVDLDELAEAIGRRLSKLTGAESGVVTAGTTAALSLATAACIAGNDPELMLRLPRTDGIPHRVVVPAGQRFDYDHAISAVGATIECAADLQSLEALLDGSTVMICLLARRDRGPLTLDTIAPLARRYNVPILIDAAGLTPSNPDRWIAAGADLVVYSGGKYLRGPQSTGVMLGRKALCEAAWLNGPPHQAFGRAMKVGKEEMVGAVAAVERWLSSSLARRERARWRPRLALMESALSRIAGVTMALLPDSEFVTAPRMRVQWDPTRIPLASESLRAMLLAGTPRILIHDFWCTPHSIVLDPVNLTDEEATQACRALRAILTRNHAAVSTDRGRAEIDVSGSWIARVDFLRGTARHRLHLEQHGDQLSGQHIARYSSAQITGRVERDRVTFIARHENGGGLPFYYSFDGTLREESLSGGLRLGAASDEHLGPVFQNQFGAAQWSATRYDYASCLPNESP